jgi:iron complex transport system substrate-binding protein
VKPGAGSVVLLCWVALVSPVVLLAAFPPRISTSMKPASLQAAPRRVAIYPPLVAAYVTADESGAHVAATSEVERTEIVDGVFGKIFPQLHTSERLSTVGGRSAVPADPEQLLALQPDRVATRAWATNGLEQMGLPVTSVSTTDLVQMWQQVAEITGKPEGIADLTESMVATEASLVENAKRHGSHAAPRVMLMWRNDARTWRVASDGHRQIQFLRGIGAAPPPRPMLAPLSAVGSFQIDTEAVLQYRPDFIFLACCAGVNEAPKALYDDPVLTSVPAVRNRRVYKTPAGGARMDGLVEWPLLLQWYGAVLFPDEHPESIREAFRAAYRNTYDYMLDDDELDRMLFVKENSVSSGYERF